MKHTHNTQPTHKDDNSVITYNTNYMQDTSVGHQQKNTTLIYKDKRNKRTKSTRKQARDKAISEY